MSSQPRIEIQGQAPFKQSGVYEAQISITTVKPSDAEIRSKQFSSIWQGNFHLKVKDGVFSETIGDSKNPLPSSVDELDTIWIIVNDLFSSLYSIFDVTLRTPPKTTDSTNQKESPDIVETQKPKRSPKSSSAGLTGARGATGDKGASGATGPTGDKGQAGPPGAQGPVGLKGQAGPPGPSGDKGATGDKGASGDK